MAPRIKRPPRKSKRRAKPGFAKRRYNKQGIDQYGATRKGPKADSGL